ncbi:MAG: glycosyltransferase family 9 protein, partial [Nitrospira sp.]
TCSIVSECEHAGRSRSSESRTPSPLIASIMAASRRTIVVIHPGGLGDVLLSFEALLAMRAGFPHHEIVLLAGSEVGDLLAQCGVIDHAWSIESDLLSTLFAGAARLSSRQRAVFQRCDLMVGWLSDEAGELQRTLQELGIPRVILQSPAMIQGGHQRERFLQALQGELPTDPRPLLRLHLPKEGLQPGRDALRAIGINHPASLIVCHPGSGSLHKCVRADTWSLLFQGCRARQLTPVIVLGPADEQAATAIQQAGILDIPILRPQSVTVLAALLAQAQGYLGHDSGVTHLAALLGVPTVAMFGPTDERRWAPQGELVAVVRGGRCACADWDAVRVCREKPCLKVQSEEVFKALEAVESCYHRVTNS